MFDGMHHQDQLFHQFISSSSSSPPSSSSRPPPSSLLHHNHLQQISSPFPNFDNPSSSSFPTPPPTSSHHHQSIQFHDLFHRPNLLSFPAPHLVIPKQYSDQHSSSSTDVVQKDIGGLIGSLLIPPSCSLVERERSSSSSSSLPHQTLHQADDIWSNEEVVALLRIRSSSETSWIPPEFTWEHVSRKLAEIGFKRSAGKCKDKFEEESRTYFNINTTYNSSGNKINNVDGYKVFSELEAFCRDDENNADDDRGGEPKHEEMEVEEAIGCQKTKTHNVAFADENQPSPIHSQPAEPAAVELLREGKAKKKIRKQHNFKVMKRLCEGFVNKMMTQQEELHNKILDDLLKRDEVTVARQEAWKRVEMERMNSEIEMRAQEQAIAGDRQAAIIEFLNKFSTTTSASSSSQNLNHCIIDENMVAHLLKVLPKPISDISKVLPTHVENDQIFVSSQNPSDQTPCPNSQTFLHETLEPQTPTSTVQQNIITKLPPALNPPPLPGPGASTMKALIQVRDPNYAAMSRAEDYGKRWPRDEVLALINLRCSFMTNSNNGDDTNGSKAPLWERISQKMSELGYKRSAKRCKEKWENINKYFRKTKDNVNKKRSLDSRTCPYFHQLSHLYKQGTLTAPSDGPENHSSLPENSLQDSRGEDTSNITGHAGEGAGQKNMQ